MFTFCTIPHFDRFKVLIILILDMLDIVLDFPISYSKNETRRDQTKYCRQIFVLFSRISLFSDFHCNIHTRKRQRNNI